MKLCNGNTWTNTLNSLLHRECCKTCFICYFLVTAEDLIWPVFFIFLFMVTGKEITFICSTALVSRPYLAWIIPVSQVLKYKGNLGKLGQNTPNHVQGHIKSDPKSSDPFHIKWDLTLVSRPSKGWVIPISQVLRYWANLGKLGLNTTQSCYGWKWHFLAKQPGHKIEKH